MKKKKHSTKAHPTRPWTLITKYITNPLLSLPTSIFTDTHDTRKSEELKQAVLESDRAQSAIAQMVSEGIMNESRARKMVRNDDYA